MIDTLDVMMVCFSQLSLDGRVIHTAAILMCTPNDLSIDIFGWDDIKQGT